MSGWRRRPIRPTRPLSLMWALDSGDEPDINALEAWELATGDGQQIAVVDTGVYRDHADFVDPELGSNVTSGYSFIAPRGSDDYSDVDDQSHGTHVTGTIAARRQNGEGIAGAAPDATIMALRALTRTGPIVSGSDSDIAEAFRHAGAAGVPMRGRRSRRAGCVAANAARRHRGLPEHALRCRRCEWRPR